MKRTARILLTLLLLLPAGLRAQYYSWGSDAPQRWMQLRTDGLRIVAPDTARFTARRTLHYVQAVQPCIGAEFDYGPLRLPFVLHAENAEANGLVMFMPKRVEFLASPAIESYSMPWVKQLVAHEYRHAVQYNNLNRGVVRVLSRLLGQQGSVVGLLFMPLWAIEGDAVMNETLMSTYGRGRQPSFSIAYRAIGRVGLDRRGRERRNIDRWFCGSYLSEIPDHYALGYQLSAHAYDRFGENIWNKVGRFGVRNPYLIFAQTIGLKKYYDTSVQQLFRETFDELEAFWAPLAATVPNTEPIVAPDTTDYTTYRWPLALPDGRVAAIKRSLARPEALVAIDSTGAERVLARLGSLSSRPAAEGNRLYWTEFSRSTLFEERVTSQLWSFEVGKDRRPRRIGAVRQALYPTPSPEGLAWVEYRPEGRYALIVGGETRALLPYGLELHGLAWDDRTSRFYTLTTSDEGMALARFEGDTVALLTRPAYVTLSDLRAADGVLWFGSIASGLDEVHRYDLATGREERITRSPYGSFAPAPSAGGLLVTTYDRFGYRPARVVEPLAEPVAWRETPIEKVNPERRVWETINLDTVRFTAADAARSEEIVPAKRFRRGLHALNLHSWAPVAFDPFRAVDEHEIDLNLGATLLSQNLLSNTELFASYGWNRNEGSLYRLGLRYNGLGVELGLDASFGGAQQIYSLGSYDPADEQMHYQPRPAIGKYRSVTASAALPFLFDRGYHLRRLTLSTAWNYSNGRIADFDAIVWEEGRIANIEQLGFRTGLNKLTFGIAFSDQVRLAHRDFLPRWGYRLQAIYAIDPIDRYFADLYGVAGRLYLPGAARHHSLQLAAAWQNNRGGYRFPSGQRPLSFKSSLLLPRGFSTAEIASDRYAACSADYRLPLCYPEGGIPSVLYIKRIRLGAGFDAASFDTADGRTSIWSCGLEAAFDFNVMRVPASGTSTLTLSLFRPSKGGTWISAELGLPF